VAHSVPGGLPDQAARPALGSAGFALIAVAAMLSTASAINATLHGSARMTYTIAKSRELPAELERPIWNQPLEGLFITVAATIVLANLLNLESISTMGSAGFLIIFAVVNVAEARTSHVRGSAAWISLVAALARVGALAALPARSSLGAASVLGAMVAASFRIEAAFRRMGSRALGAHGGQAHGRQNGDLWPSEAAGQGVVEQVPSARCRAGYAQMVSTDPATSDTSMALRPDLCVTWCPFLPVGLGSSRRGRAWPGRSAPQGSDGSDRGCRGSWGQPSLTAGGELRAGRLFA